MIDTLKVDFQVSLSPSKEAWSASLELALAVTTPLVALL